MAKTAETSEETTESIVQDIYRESLEQIRDEIQAVRTGKKKPKRHTPTETVAYLAKQATFLAAEERKSKAAAAKKLDGITKALVLEWYRQLDREEQRRVGAELGLIATRKSGLA